MLFSDKNILSVVADGTVLAAAGLDFAELSLIFLHIVGEGKHELLSVFGTMITRLTTGRRAFRGCEDKVDEELVGPWPIIARLLYFPSAISGRS